MRLGRRLAIGLLAASSVCAAVTVALWLGGTNWIRYTRAFRNSYPVQDGPAVTDEGVWSIGVYCDHGAIGFLNLQTGVGGLDPDEVDLTVQPSYDSDETGWRWTRSGEINDYMGGVPDDLVPAWATRSIPHVAYLCIGDDVAMRHFLRIRALMFSAPALLSVLLVPWCAYGTALLRRHRQRRSGCCAACGYDLRATPTRCPECGAAAAVSAVDASAARSASPS